MRMLVFFDLPMVSKAEKRAYTVFRRFLLNDGYDMIQFSVYGRILNGSDAVDKHMRRLLANLPTLLEKRFARLRAEAEAAEHATSDAAPPWQPHFQQELDGLLQAELDLRWQPIAGLLAALPAPGPSDPLA